MNDTPTAVPERVTRAQAQARAVGFAMGCENRTGALLRTLAASKPAGRFLEVGTGVGIGAAWLLAGMGPDARLTTIELDTAHARLARHILAGDDRVEIVGSDVADWLVRYDGPPFDLAFVDWRTGKFEHRDLVLRHLAPGALYVGDDLNPQATWPPDHDERVSRFLAEIVDEPALVVTLMDWASGLIVAAYQPGA